MPTATTGEARIEIDVADEDASRTVSVGRNYALGSRVEWPDPVG
ncbi:hypothetical protein [Mycolicibacterium moriokaense]|nr:hypothetical protein [Mycolicibacterium moriokaense]